MIVHAVRINSKIYIGSCFKPEVQNCQHNSKICRNTHPHTTTSFFKSKKKFIIKNNLDFFLNCSDVFFSNFSRHGKSDALLTN